MLPPTDTPVGFATVPGFALVDTFGASPSATDAARHRAQNSKSVLVPPAASPAVRHLGNPSCAPEARGLIVLEPGAALPTLRRRLPASDASVSRTAPGLPRPASNTAPWIPSPLPRLLVRATIRRAIVVVPGCCRTAAVQIGTHRLLQRPTQPLPASSCGHQFPRSCKTYSPPGRSGERAGITVTRVTGYLRVHREHVDAHLFARWRTLRIRHFNGLDCSIESRRPRSSEPQPFYSAAIFMRFRGPQAPKDISR